MSDRHYVHPHDEIALAKLLKESKPFLERYGTTIIYALAAVMAIAAVVVYVQRRPSPTADASHQLLLATTAEDYQNVADKFSDTPIGILSRLRQADRKLEDAVSAMFTNREAALDDLATAQKAYEELENRKDIVDAVRERVLVGLARVAECRCDGSEESIKAATAAWERILTSFPDSKTFKDAAESRVKRLGTKDCSEFYAWFHELNPKSGDDLLLPQDGRPGQVPGMPNFPTLQELGLPSGHPPITPIAPGGTEKSAGEKTSATEPAESTEPANDAEKGEAPAEGTSAEPAATPEPASDVKAENPAPDAPKVDAPAGDAAPADAPKAETPAVDPAADPPAADPPAAEPTTPEKSGE